MGSYLLGRITTEQLLALESARIAEERDEINAIAGLQAAIDAEIAAEDVIARVRDVERVAHRARRA
jgi:hypothetical protein